MSNQNKTYLCGGVFVSVLADARKQRQNPRNCLDGKSDGLGDVHLLLDLLRLIDENYKYTKKDTFKGSVSSYKNCLKNSIVNFDFSEHSSAIQNYDYIIKNNYKQALVQMCELLDKFLDIKGSSKKDVQLIKRLYKLIEDCTTEEECFYVNADGTPSTKSELLSSTSFCFYSFVLGVWHFVLTKRANNMLGRYTIETEQYKPTTSATFTLTYDFDKTIPVETKKEPIDEIADEPIIETVEDEYVDEVVSPNKSRNGVKPTVNYVKNMFLGNVTYNDYSTTNISGNEVDEDDE